MHTGTSDPLNAFPWPPVGEIKQTNTKLADVIINVETRIPGQDKLTHIAGEDSFHRIVERNLLRTDPRPRIVVERPGVSAQKTRSMNVKFISGETTNPISANPNHS
jgi:hypothetical protein